MIRALVGRCFQTATVLLLAACTHSDSFPTGTDYGAIGPLVPGPEASLGAIGADASWTENGGGILYSAACLSRGQPPPDPIFPTKTIPSILLLPASGGSAFWELCRSRKVADRPRSPASPGDSTHHTVWRGTRCRRPPYLCRMCLALAPRNPASGVPELRQFWRHLDVALRFGGAVHPQAETLYSLSALRWRQPDARSTTS